MAKITITTKENSFLLNGVEYQKGTLNINHSDDGISIGSVFAKFSEVTANNSVFNSKNDLSDWISSNLFKNGGGDGSGSQNGVENVTGNLVTGTAKNPIVSLKGTPKDVVTFDANGNPDIKPIGITQLTDINGFPQFANGVFVATGMNPTDKTGLLSFVEFSSGTPKSGTFPTYNTGGRLPVANGVNPGDAANMSQINALLPTPPMSGNYLLMSINGVVQWVDG